MNSSSIWLSSYSSGCLINIVIAFGIWHLWGMIKVFWFEIFQRKIFKFPWFIGVCGGASRLRSSALWSGVVRSCSRAILASRMNPNSFQFFLINRKKIKINLNGKTSTFFIIFVYIYIHVYYVKISNFFMKPSKFPLNFRVITVRAFDCFPFWEK